MLIVFLLKQDREQGQPPRTADSVSQVLGIPPIRVQLYLAFLSDEEISKVKKLPGDPPTYQYAE